MTNSERFIGRRLERSALQKELDRPRPSLIILYGRRRVGKSRLITETTRDRKTIYYQATQVLGSMNLAMLKDEVIHYLPTDDPILRGIGEWEALLSYIAEAARNEPAGLTLVFDEFPYICETVDALPSIVQKVFDRVTNENIPLNIVLCGSKISFMEDLLGERNPLRGRQTLELELEPLTYRETALFFPHLSPLERLQAYGVFGGIPYYLQLCDQERPLRDNIEEVVLQPGAPLSNEAINVLRAELMSPTRYATILQAIASGCTTTGDILGRVIDISNGASLTPYIKKLEALRLIRVTRSLDASPKARNRRYYLADPFLAFYYRFGLPNRSALSKGHFSDVYEYAIEPHFNAYMGEIFEWIAYQFIAHHAQELLPTSAREIGKIWNAGFDIDVAATLLDDSRVVGECKWWDGVVGENVFRGLKRDAEETTYGRDAPRTFYLIFSKTGFTDDLVDIAEHNPDLHLLSVDDLLTDAPTEENS